MDHDRYNNGSPLKNPSILDGLAGTRLYGTPLCAGMSVCRHSQPQDQVNLPHHQHHCQGAVASMPRVKAYQYPQAKFQGSGSPASHRMQNCGKFLGTQPGSCEFCHKWRQWRRLRLGVMAKDFLGALQDLQFTVSCLGL